MGKEVTKPRGLKIAFLRSWVVLAACLAFTVSIPSGFAVAASTAWFDEVPGAIPNQLPNWVEMITYTFVHVVPVDISHDGLDDLVLHYWANGVGTNPPTNVPCRNKLVVLVQQLDHTFVDLTATYLAGPADLGACSAWHSVVDVNEDGWSDVIYPTSQEDGRDASDGSKMYAPATALVSRPDGKYQVETFGTPTWFHMSGIGYDEQGKVVAAASGYFGGSSLHQREANGTWTNVSAGWPELSPNSFSLFNATSATGPSDFMIGNALYPDAYGIAGAYRDMANVWHSVPTLHPFPELGNLTLINWQGTPGTAAVAGFDDLAITAGTFLGACQFRVKPDAPTTTILKLSVKSIPGGYQGPDQVVDESDLIPLTRLIGARMVSSSLQRVPLQILDEQSGLETRFFDCKDFNGDGYDDIAVYPYSNKGYPLVYINNQVGSLVWAGEKVYPPQPETWNIAGTSILHDFDMDGIPDLLTWPGTGLDYHSGSQLKFHYYRGLVKLPTPDKTFYDGFEN